MYLCLNKLWTWTIYTEACTCVEVVHPPKTPSKETNLKIERTEGKKHDQGELTKMIKMQFTNGEKTDQLSSG